MYKKNLNGEIAFALINSILPNIKGQYGYSTIENKASNIKMFSSARYLWNKSDDDLFCGMADQ